MGTRPQHHPDYVHLRTALRKTRLDAGLTIRALGAKLDRPFSYVNKVEQGIRRIDPIEFIGWCRACGVDAPALLRQIARKVH